MTSIERIDKLLERIQTVELSAILPQMLSLALEIGDYQGYVLLSNWNCPLCEHPQANAVQKNEVLCSLILNGLSHEKAQEIEAEATEQYIAMKTIGDDEILVHSTKEMETWLEQYGRIKNTNIPRMDQINKRKKQIEHQYELLRSILISKLANYRQQLIMEGNGVMDSISNDALNMSKVFVVHGHNGEMKEAVARLVERQGLQAVILHEKANQGATIIEKFERNSDVSCAICLFTADDFGRAKAAEKETKRARQNVVFEAGYFIGKLGREKVILIADQGVEIPSDLRGVVYTDSRNWRFSVLQELKAIGYNIDYNKLD